MNSEYWNDNEFRVLDPHCNQNLEYWIDNVTKIQSIGSTMNLEYWIDNEFRVLDQQCSPKRMDTDSSSSSPELETILVVGQNIFVDIEICLNLNWPDIDMVTIVIGNILSHLSTSQPTILTIIISSVTIPMVTILIGNLRGLDVRVPPQSLPNSWSPPVLYSFDKFYYFLMGMVTCF